MVEPGPQHDVRVNSVWLYNRPDFAKLQCACSTGLHSPGLEPISTASSFARMPPHIAFLARHHLLAEAVGGIL
jgi:hypothetical protein